MKKFKIIKNKEDEIVYCGKEIIALLKISYIKMQQVIGNISVPYLPIGSLRGKKGQIQSEYRKIKDLFVREDYRDFGAYEFIEDYWLNKNNFCRIKYIDIDVLKGKCGNI